MNTHLILLHEASEGLDREAMQRHWLKVRAPWAAGLPSVRRYVQDIVLAQSDGRHNWFGVEEFWTDDAPAALALLHTLSEPGAGDAAAPSLASATRPLCLLVWDDVVLAGSPIAPGESLPKRMTFLVRKPGLSREEMLHYWRHSHGPLAASVPGVRRYVQSPVVDTPGGSAPAPAIEGVMQVWIDSEAALQAMVTSPLFRERLKPDEANFVDTDHTFTLSVCEQRVV